ncbi:hypothetical protein Kfla_4421 [Kribbella flavida DSM 17836]|uniref:Uncharacterized protein n=1 Tax=Kribbella flavida (strain DSM 17836 / JCM 10339 / NBRC 14399) TaxID=479435 RepID=D2PWI5_KRIFD|nr:hypothetical protein Kfla_4421 [Kribbella flavida DSM 17836]
MPSGSFVAMPGTPPAVTEAWRQVGAVGMPQDLGQLTVLQSAFVRMPAVHTVPLGHSQRQPRRQVRSQDGMVPSTR